MVTAMRDGQPQGLKGKLNPDEEEKQQSLGRREHFLSSELKGG